MEPVFESFADIHNQKQRKLYFWVQFLSLVEVIKIKKLSNLKNLDRSISVLTAR